MELIYLYIEKFGDFVQKQELPLSNNFDVKMQDKKLIVRKKHNHLKNFYGKKINNISVFVGKNGSGKTTVLDILGMTRKDRLRTSVLGKHVKDEYLLLYYIGIDDDGNDLFGIEVTGENVLQNIITNYSHENDDERYDRSKTSIGKIYKYENDIFISAERHFFDFKIDHEKLSKLIKFAYIGEPYRYSLRNKQYGNYYAWDGGYIAERNLLAQPSAYHKYSTLVKCINKDIKGFDCDKAIVRFYDEIDYQYRTDKDDFAGYKKIIGEIEENLYITSGIKVIRFAAKENTQTTEKVTYLLNLYSRYIMDMIVNGLFTSCIHNKKEDTSKGNPISFSIPELIEYVKTLGPCHSSEDQLGNPTNFENELFLIMELSKQLKSVFKDNKLEYLKLLARYVCSRLHTTLENDEFRYIESFEKIIKYLFDVPEVFFHSNNVELIIDGKKNPSLEKLLEIYSHYVLMHAHDLHSDMGIKFKITFELLSEGEERFIDIISKVTDSIDENEDTKLLVLLLDEPDQSLHPEWSRRFIDVITQAIDSISFEGNIQLILSTHSPYLLSDILPTGILKFDRNSESRNLKIFTSNKNNQFSGLGANIYDLMKQEFFMNNTIGEFATKKINMYSKKIKALSKNSENIQEIEYFINQIGEPIIKKALRKQLESEKQKLNIKENTVELLELITNEQDREKVRAYLQMIGVQE